MIKPLKGKKPKTILHTGCY